LPASKHILRRPLAACPQIRTLTSTDSGGEGGAKGTSRVAVPASSHVIEGVEYPSDSMTNVTPKILSLLERKIHLQDRHPLSLIKKRIVNYMYERYRGPRGPLFSLHDRLCPVVSLEANFDSLLVPKDHVSRAKSESYYLNSKHMLRAHTSAHQTDLIGMGLDNFLVAGDVYRRDTVDSTHYPVFHQIEGVRLVNPHELPSMVGLNGGQTIEAFENGVRTQDKQEFHSIDACMIIEKDLKDCLLGLAKELFGNDIEYKWVDCYFPFTHPSWELEILYQGKWLEVLGCGIVEQEILHSAGAGDKIGFAFGLGLERLAMKLYQIPDIRIFWSQDSGVTSQFNTDNPNKEIIYKAVSKNPPCINDISFWLPASTDDGDEEFSANDFYDIVRSVGGDQVEQVELVDDFVHPKKRRRSHCYRIVYRDMHKTMTQTEANAIHAKIEQAAKQKLNVELR